MWDIWSVGLEICWLAVAYGWYAQGKIVQQKGDYSNVSLKLPFIMFSTQCFLLAKGIYYDDWSLISGCILVNTAIVYALIQVTKVKILKKGRKL